MRCPRTMPLRSWRPPRQGEWVSITAERKRYVYHFFTETEFFTESEAVITGPDVNHIKNVLRMKPGEQILLSDGKGD